MPIESENPRPTPTESRKDKAGDTREAVVQDADETGVENRDLVHGDGGTLGLDDEEDLNRND
jgi:hypothetical protein